MFPIRPMEFTKLSDINKAIADQLLRIGTAFSPSMLPFSEISSLALMSASLARLKIRACTERYRRRLCDWSSHTAQRSRVLLRAIGLSLAARIKGDEPPKVLIARSRRTAIAHSAVHIVPASVSLIVIAINFQGFFIGGELQGTQGADGLKLGSLQFAAKAQVCLCHQRICHRAIHTDCSA